MVKLEIVQLEEAEFSGKKLQYEYDTAHYYDISVVSDGGHGWSAKLELKDLPTAVTKRFESQLFETYVENPVAYQCIYNGVVAGFMQLGFESWNRRLRVWEILVNARFRKAGIGSRLIEKAKVDARALGARMIILETQSCNVPAIRFYLKQGFELVGFDLGSYSNEDQQKKEVRLEFGYRV